jgi:integrase
VIRERPDRNGLQVQVYAGRDPLTGRKRYVSRQVPGKGRAAWKAAKQVEGELLAQVGAGRHRGSGSQTVGELVKRWLEWRQSAKPISPTTLAGYRGYIDRAILPALGKFPLRQLDAATLDAFYARLRQTGGKGGQPMAASTVRQVHAILSGALKRAAAWGWISHNPARLTMPPSVERADIQPPSVADAARLLRVAQAEQPELGLFLRLAVVLGARRGELCALRWSDVDLDQGAILVAGSVIAVRGQGPTAKDTKTHAKRRVAVGAGTVDLLRAHRVEQAKTALACGVALAPSAFVFSHAADASTPVRPDYMTHRFVKLARRLGVRCRLHDLRHFMVTQLVAGGVDWRTVSGRAGHVDGHMTLGTYAHFQQAQDRQAAELMEHLLIPGDAAIEAGRNPPET